MDDFQPMLPDLCNLIVAILQSKCVSPAVDIAKSVSSFNSFLKQILYLKKKSNLFLFRSASFYTTKHHNVHQ